MRIQNSVVSSQHAGADQSAPLDIPGLSSSSERIHALSLREIMSRLRAPDGCPWDREQTHTTLRSSLIEEAYEVLDAIEHGDDAHLREELGDLLLQVVFHADIAQERGAFTYEDIEASICEKLLRRHPHVFADASAQDSAEVLRQWEQIKRKERGDGGSIMDGADRTLPALMQAQNVQRKAARVGFDWQRPDEVFAKIEEEIAELRVELESDGIRSAAALEDELGDILFSVVNLARHLEIDSEVALARATRKFTRRFRAMEADFATRDKRIEDAPLDEMEATWQSVKNSVVSVSIADAKHDGSRTCAIVLC